MQRKQIQLTSDIIQAVGINIFKNHRSCNIWKFVVGLTLYSLVDVFCFMVSITNIDNFYRFATPIPYIGGSFVLQEGIFFIYYHRKIVGEILSQIDKNFYTYPDEDLLEIDYVWYLREENMVFMIKLAKYPLFSAIFIITLPIFGEILYYGRIKTFIYPIWLPWSVNSLKADLLVSMFQFIQGFCGLYFNYAITAFLFVVVTEFMRQYRRLIAAVKSLEIRTSKKLQEGGCFNKIFRENIIHCIRHHQVLIRNFRLFEIWFSMFFSLELMMCFTTLAFTLRLAMNISSLSEIISVFPVVLFILLGVLLRCLISEIFPNLNESLADSLLWEVPWYQVNKENQRLLKMFHSTARQPLVLHGLSIFEATRVTFGKLVRTAYSIFNVMNRKESMN